MTDTTIYGGENRLNIDPENGIITLQLGPISVKAGCHALVSLPGEAPRRISGARTVEIDRGPVADVNGAGTLLAARFADELYDLGLRLEAVAYENAPFVALRVGVLNHGVEQVYVHKITLLDSLQMELGTGPLSGWVNGFHSWSYTGFVPHNWRQPRAATRLLTGPQSTNPTTPLPRAPGQYVGEWVAALIQPGQQALVAGFIGVEDQLGQVYLDGRPRQRSLRLENTLDGIPMVSGELLWSEWAILYRVRFPAPDPLNAYAEAVTRLTKPRFPAAGPVPGWSGWYQFFDQVTSADMRRNQHALRMVNDYLPLDLVQLDDGYQSAWGDWLQPNSRFPEGVGGWADSVRNDGFEPGLWVSPFVVDPQSAIYRQYPEAVLRDRRGRAVHGGFLLQRWLKGLDVTHPAAQDYLRQVFETVVYQWGIRYLKLDYLYAATLPALRYDPTRTRAQALRDGLHLIREVAGDDVTILGCGCPLGPAIGLVDIVRVSADVAPEWYPDLLGVKAFFRRDFNLPSARNSLSASIHRSWTHRRWWWLDADNLLVREKQKLSHVEVQTLVTVIGLLDSHIVLSDDLVEVPPERLRWAASLLPIIPGEVEIPGLFEQPLPGTIIKRYFGPTGPHVAVALINWQDRPVPCSLSRAELGLPAGMPLLIYNFWNRTARVVSDAAFSAGQLPPHGTALFAVRPVTPGPQLAGTDLHISMGGEVTRWEVGPESLAFTVDVGRRAEGDIWLKLPGAPQRVVCNGQDIGIVPVGTSSLFVVHVEADRQASVEMRFSSMADTGR